jgi:predicted pyridoxine 5'-phosphate oxidase superfamily flavin-nucleotide-binding protein
MKTDNEAMNEISHQELEDITRRYQELMTLQQTLLLSTASTNGIPDIRCVGRNKAFRASARISVSGNLEDC